MKKKQGRKTGTSAASKEQRRLLFVQAFIANGENRTQAAIAAGYGEHSAAAAGCRLIAEDKTMAMVEEARERMRAKFGLTAENVARQIGAIVNFDMRRLFDADGKMLPVNQWPDEVAFAVAGLEVTQRDGEEVYTITKHKVWDKNAGIANALKVLGMSKERLSLEMPETTQEGERNMLDVARRVAFVLASGARLAQEEGRKEALVKLPKSQKLLVDRKLKK